MPVIPVYSYEDLRKKADDFLLAHNPSGHMPVPIEEQAKKFRERMKKGEI